MNKVIICDLRVLRLDTDTERDILSIITKNSTLHISFFTQSKRTELLIFLCSFFFSLHNPRELNTQLREELAKMKDLQDSLTSCSRRAREAEVKYLSTKKDLVDAGMTRWAGGEGDDGMLGWWGGSDDALHILLTAARRKKRCVMLCCVPSFL